MKKRNLLVAGVTGVVLTAGSVTFGATALAAPAAPAVIKACVADKGGAMYQVSSKTTKCAKGQRLVTWNQTGVQGAPGKTGAPGALGKNGLPGTPGAKGDTGPAGPQGPQGAPGLAGLAGTHIASGVGPASDDVKAAAEKGDFYVDLTPDNVTIAVFDGTEYGQPVPLQGAAGLPGDDGDDGTQIRSGMGAAGVEIEAASNKGDLYLDLTTGKVTLAVFDGEKYGPATPLQGADGKDGKSVTVKREAVATPARDADKFTLTFACAADETAIGAGYSGVDPTAQLVGSDAGSLPTQWVLTFDADPGATATGTALCAAMV